MKRLRALLIAFMTVGFLSFASVAPAYAWSPFGSVDCTGKAAKSAVCTEKGNTENPISGANGLVMKVINIVAYVAGVAAIIIIVLAGLRMVTSGGSSEDIAGARRSLIYALVGIVVIVLARTIIAFVLSAL